jgi:hypothetical protein
MCPAECSQDSGDYLFGSNMAQPRLVGRGRRPLQAPLSSVRTASLTPHYYRVPSLTPPKVEIRRRVPDRLPRQRVRARDAGPTRAE